MVECQRIGPGRLHRLGNGAGNLPFALPEVLRQALGVRVPGIAHLYGMARRLPQAVRLGAVGLELG